MPEGYESLRGRERAVIVVFAAIFVAYLAAVASSLMELNLLDRFESGALVSDGEVSDNDTRQRAMGLLQLALFVVAAIVFIRWLRAAYRNADAVAPGVRRYGHGWAIGAWFVPILNLWRPKQIVNDVWRAGAENPDDDRPSILLLAWWLSWIASTLLGRVAGRAAVDQDTIADLRTADFLYIVSDGWDAIVAVMAITVVRATTRRLDRKAASEGARPRDDPLAATSVAPPAALAWSPATPERPAG
jgi:Domain of unknown function (DUF4328)